MRCLKNDGYTKKQLKNILPKVFMFGTGLGIFSAAVYYLSVK